jgi:opacity protein-like surface antigen
MKINVSMVLGCFMLLSMSTLVYGAQGPYMKGNLGYAIARDADFSDSSASAEVDFDAGLGLGVAAGYDFGNNMRLEAEIAYQKNDFDSICLGSSDVDLTGDATSLALLLNGYLDFKNESPYTTYFMAGIGAAKAEINGFNVVGSGFPDENEDDTVFAYQFGVGIGYAVTPKVNIDFEYRFFATCDPEFGDMEAEFSSHNLNVGLRVAF